ncbi:MAG: hypothetical protein H0T76_17035 [Nannocystis sp.]|nr:hypothetical protein [Nannocystis sp.]MBA3548189.1 hypothetical protein [Nannocystis sp.]
MRRAWWRSSIPGVLAGFLVGAAAVGACTPSGPRDAAQVVADPALQQILQHIPIDTPYAFVSMGSKGTRDFITKIYAPLQKMMPQLEARLPDIGSLGLAQDKQALLRAVIGELKGRLSADGLAELGLDVDARFAFYGIGLLPAMRWQLRDPAALRAAIERVQTQSGTRFPTATLGNVEYWPIPGDKLEGAVAIVGDQLVWGFAPAAQKDRAFALLLGSERPARHLGNSEGFQQLLAEYGLAKVSAGFVDARILAEAFLGEGDALNKDTLAALVPEVAARWPTLTDPCKQEVRSLVALAPRLIFGTEKIDGEGFAGKFIVELRRDIAQELMAMRTSVPGLSVDGMKNAIFAMGAGLDVERAMNFAQSKASAVQAAPYSCPALFDLNEAAGDMITEIKQADPEAWKIRGGAMVIDDLKLAGMVPTEVHGFVSFAFTDTKKMMSTLSTFTKAPLTDDGSVAALADNTIPFLTGTHYGITAGRGGVLTFGAESEARARTLLAFPDQADPPLLVMVYDMSRFAELMGKFMQTGGGSAEMTMLIDFYKVFGAVSYDAHATERGVVFNTRMPLH